MGDCCGGVGRALGCDSGVCSVVFLWCGIRVGRRSALLFFLLSLSVVMRSDAMICLIFAAGRDPCPSVCVPLCAHVPLCWGREGGREGACCFFSGVSLAGVSASLPLFNLFGRGRFGRLGHQVGGLTVTKTLALGQDTQRHY